MEREQFRRFSICFSFFLATNNRCFFALIAVIDLIAIEFRPECTRNCI